MRRIAGFLMASFAASLLFFAIFIPGGLFFSGRLGDWTMRIDAVAVLVWAVLGWPVVALIALFPAMAFTRYAERTGQSGALMFSLAGLAAALMPAVFWLLAQATSGGRMDLAWLAAAGLLMAGTFGGLVFWLVAGNRVSALRAPAMTD